MPPFGPISHRNLVKMLKKAGFKGPLSGGKHLFMIKGNLVLTIPNPNRGDISKDLLSRILKQAGIEKQDWEKL